VGALVFSVEAVFSYSVVDLRGIMPPMCPTVRALALLSNLDTVVLGFTGLKMLSKSETNNPIILNASGHLAMLTIISRYERFWLR